MKKSFITLRPDQGLVCLLTNKTSERQLAKNEAFYPSTRVDILFWISLVIYG